jgi:hypothetical protein
MSTTVDTATDIRTFSIDIADEQIDDLRRRIAATRLPSKELVEDRSQGVQLATIHELARYWADDYDFGRIEARLNELPSAAHCVPHSRCSAAAARARSFTRRPFLTPRRRW